MGRELYQLIAIDKNNNQYVIELNNENKNNKGILEFIDFGTVRFRDEKHLTEYLYSKGKIPTKDVKIFIKYKHNGDKYLPIIYNDPDLKFYLSLDEAGKIDHVERFFRLIQIEFEKLKFYNFFLTENSCNSKEVNNGNYINNKLFYDLIAFYDEYIKYKRYGQERTNFQRSIIKELSNYKQFRTMYQFYKSYFQNYKINVEVDEREFSQVIHDNKGQQINDGNIFNDNVEDFPEIPDDILNAYKANGMDGVYGIVDLDNLAALGIENLDSFESKGKKIK